jgi:hypothetical protein
MRQDMHRLAHGRYRPSLDDHDEGEAEVQEVLEALARAVTTGNGEGAAECWAVPAFVIGDEHEQAVSSLAGVAQFFGGARELYNARGIGDTRPELQAVDWLGESMALVEVRWPWLNAEGEEAGSETSTYLLKRDRSGELKLRVAMLHGAQPGRAHS